MTMNPINVLLFGEKLPIAGQAAHCVVEHDDIYIKSKTPDTTINQSIQFAHLQAKVAGFDHDQLQLIWQHDQAKWSLLPLSNIDQKALLAALPAEGIAGFKAWKRATQSQSMVWKSIVYGLGFIGLSATLLLWQHDLITTWAANQVSIKTEKRLGDSVLNSLNPEANFLKDGAALKAVQKIGKQLTLGSEYQYQWYVSKDAAVNAFAIPGGIIVVNSGLLKKADSPNELAAVLAHEVQHVEQKHALKNMLNSAGIAAVVLVVLGDANAMIMLMAHQVSAQYFNRQVESEADLKGLQLLQKNKIDPSGMVAFFHKMEPDLQEKNAADKTAESTSKKSKQTKETTVAGWFSSHPDTLSRIDAIEQYLAKNPCKDCKSLAWDKAAILENLNKQN